MHFRESGMPEQASWETFFDVPLILDRFGFGLGTGDVVELGSGYGTFTIPLAQRISGRVIAIDVDPTMVETTRSRSVAAGLRNVEVAMRDVMADGFGVPAGSCDAVLLFNILHCEEPYHVMDAAREILRLGGQVAVIHWRSDVATPRGPNLAIRPSADAVTEWAVAVGGLTPEKPSFLLPPWHYGVSLTKTEL